MKTLLTLLGLLTVIVMVSCTSQAGPPAPDMTPIGEGLKVIGFALIATAVVITVGRFLNKEP